jgi:hypothetical protein
VSVYDTATGKRVATLVDTGPNHQNIKRPAIDADNDAIEWRMKLVFNIH